MQPALGLKAEGDAVRWKTPVAALPPHIMAAIDVQPILGWSPL